MDTYKPTIVNETINEMQDEISTLNQRIAMLESIDLSNPINEDDWHEVCETSLRGTDILADIIQSTFQGAENIKISYNFVFFNLFGFNVQIPTSRTRGINVDTSWYTKDTGMPPLQYSDREFRMKQYFELIDNGGGTWYELAELRIGRGWRKWCLWLLWFFKYKRKDPKRVWWEKRFDKIERQFNESLAEYQSQRSEIKNKVASLQNDLLPAIETFSKKHLPYQTSNPAQQQRYTIDQILDIEGC